MIIESMFVYGFFLDFLYTSEPRPDVLDNTHTYTGCTITSVILF